MARCSWSSACARATLRSLGREHFASAYLSPDYTGRDRVLVALAHGEATWPKATPEPEAGEGADAPEAAAEPEAADYASMTPAERSLLEAQEAGLPIIDLDAE